MKVPKDNYQTAVTTLLSCMTPYIHTVFETYERLVLGPVTASIVSCSMQPLHMKSVLDFIEKKTSQEESITWSQTIIEKGFSALEKLLKDFAGRYSTGDEVTMADVFLAPQISIAMSRFKTDMSKYPTLRRVYESCEALPEFQASIPERQPDAK